MNFTINIADWWFQLQLILTIWPGLCLLLLQGDSRLYESFLWQLIKGKSFNYLKRDGEEGSAAMDLRGWLNLTSDELTQEAESGHQPGAVGKYSWPMKQTPAPAKACDLSKHLVMFLLTSKQPKEQPFTLQQSQQGIRGLRCPGS